MTRLIILLIAIVMVYWLVRNVIRAFLRGLNPENENVKGGGVRRRSQDYKDVQDAEFKDISDEK